MICAVGSDHAGFIMKSHVIEVLNTLGNEVRDVGSFTPEPVDFPDIARLVCDAVRRGDVERGVLVCGTGVGASIAANKIPGIRASVCHDPYSAHQSVEHDNVNVLCLGAQIVGTKLITELLKVFMNARFDDQEHFRRRVKKIQELELAAARELQQMDSR